MATDSVRALPLSDLLRNRVELARNLTSFEARRLLRGEGEHEFRLERLGVDPEGEVRWSLYWVLTAPVAARALRQRAA